jgi:sulfur carrier protein
MTTQTIEATLPIRVNGEAHRVPPGLTARTLLARLELEPGRVVVERNGVILRRDALGSAPVEADDAFEIVHFVGGG